eukprot:9039216-Alexandrium_andersonii.AAC.1
MCIRDSSGARPGRGPDAQCLLSVIREAPPKAAPRPQRLTPNTALGSTILAETGSWRCCGCGALLSAFYAL